MHGIFYFYFENGIFIAFEDCSKLENSHYSPFFFFFFFALWRWNDFERVRLKDHVRLSTGTNKQKKIYSETE